MALLDRELVGMLGATLGCVGWFRLSFCWTGLWGMDVHTRNRAWLVRGLGLDRHRLESGSGRGVSRLRQAQLLPDQVINEVGGVQPACRADESHWALRHLRRNVEGILRTAGTLDLHFGLGLGFSRTTPWVKTREKGVRAEPGSARPSQNRKLPPRLPWLFPGGLPVLEKAYSPAAFD